MNFRRKLIYSLIPPLMILISFIGLIFRSESKKKFYLPIGIIGIYLILDKELNRKLTRKNILKKIQSFKKDK